MESLEGSGRVMGGVQSLLLRHDQVLPLLVGARSKAESDHHRCVSLIRIPPPLPSTASVRVDCRCSHDGLGARILP
jgi:hypothetical protein